MTRVIRRRVHWATISITVGVCAALVVAALLATRYVKDQSPLPDSVRRQVSFAIFLPTAGVTIDKASYKFDPPQKILTFTGRLADGQAVTFAEQPTPDPFSDIPNFYQTVLNNMFEYQSFDGVQGTIYLTHPKNAGQAAVLNAKGTLVFARVAKDEPAETWRPLFNAMQVYLP